MLSGTQRTRLRQWHSWISLHWLQLNRPVWLVQWLAKVLPDHCTFAKAKYFRQHLVLYIPNLCQLNPYFSAIIAERIRQDSVDNKD